MQTLEQTPETTKQSQNLSPMRQKMDAAWSRERINALGESQKDRLSAWVARGRASKGDEYPTVPVLQGMLEMLETYYPEESSRSLPI
jgi:hypothetical protein